MTEVVQLPDTREQDAQHLFSNYVQSVAFNLTLSRSMIAALQIVRDFGFPAAGSENWTESYRDAKSAARQAHANGADSFTSGFRAIQRRGLAYHVYPADPGTNHYRLTKAGELTCALLVEAGLLPAAMPKQRKSA